VIEVWSWLWPSTVIGKRSYRNTLDLFRDLSDRMNREVAPLVTTDGFRFYERVIGRVFGPACVYGQVIKTRRNDRIVKVERRAVIGAGRLQQATGLGRVSETEHLVCGTAESHDPTRLVVSGALDNMSSKVEGKSQRSHRVVPLLLQLQSASHSAQIRL